MSLRIWMMISAVIFVVVGAAFALFTPNLLALFGMTELPPFIPESPDAVLAWSAVTFARLFGVMLFALGTLLWFLRSGIAWRARRSAAVALFIGVATAAAFSFVQQVTIWRTAAGWLLFGVLLVLAVGYAYWAFFPRVIVPEPEDVLELERTTPQDHPESNGPNEREDEERV